MSPGETTSERLETIQKQLSYFQPGKVSLFTRAEVYDTATQFYRLGAEMGEEGSRKAVSDYLSGSEIATNIGELEAVQRLEEVCTLRPKCGGLTSRQERQLRRALKTLFDAGAETNGRPEGEKIARYLSGMQGLAHDTLGFSAQVAENRRVLDTRPCGED